MLLKLIKLALSNPSLTLKLFSWRRLKNLIAALIENRGDGAQIVSRYSDIYQANSGAHDALREQVLSHKSLKGDLLVLPIIDWGFRYQRPQHIAAGLARQGWRVFYLATTPLLASDDDYRLTANPTDNLYLCQLRAGDSAANMHESTMDDAACAAYLQSFKTMQRDLNLADPVVLVDHPYWQKLAAALPQKLMTYDCMDHHAGFADGDSKEDSAEETALVRQADVLAVSSDYLMDKFAGVRQDAVMVRNGCDSAFFSTTPPAPRAAPPVAGYVGAISSWYDIDLVTRTARLLPHWRFVLVGATHGCDTSAARREPNIEFVGEVDYTTLPQEQLSRFDVCLIPFIVNELIRATNPVKLYEYLAAGRPVVSTAMPEVVKLKDKALIAETPETFAAAIEAAYAAGADSALVKSWQEWARGEDWAQRSATLGAAIDGALMKRTAA